MGKVAASGVGSTPKIWLGDDRGQKTTVSTYLMNDHFRFTRIESPLKFYLKLFIEGVVHRRWYNGTVFDPIGVMFKYTYSQFECRFYYLLENFCQKANFHPSHDQYQSWSCVSPLAQMNGSLKGQIRFN